MLPESRLQTKTIDTVTIPYGSQTQQPASTHHTTHQTQQRQRLPPTDDTCPDALLLKEVSEYSTLFIGNFQRGGKRRKNSIPAFFQYITSNLFMRVSIFIGFVANAFALFELSSLLAAEQ